MSKVRKAVTLTAAILLGLTAAFADHWIPASAGLPNSLPALRSLTMDRVSGSALYVRTADAALFKSTDSGGSWKMVGNASGVVSLALAPSDANTVYAGKMHGVLRSTDGGETWKFGRLPGVLVTALAVDPGTPSTVYANGMGDRIYKSIDGGETWSAFSLGFTAPPYVSGIASITIDPQNPATLYVATGGPNLPLYKSTDGGGTWTVANAGPVGHIFSIDPRTSTLYGLAMRGLSKSTDGGATWTAMGSSGAVFGFDIDPADPNTLYLTTIGPNLTAPSILRSTDGGNTWNPLTTAVPPAWQLAISPADSSIHAVTNAGMFKSVDGGMNWIESNTGLRVFGVRVLAADPADPASVYAGADEGLFKSADAAATWSPQAVFRVAAGTLPPGAPPPATPIPGAAAVSVQSLLISSTNPDIVYAGTHRTDGCFFADALLFKSTDRASTWTNSASPASSGCVYDTLMAIDPQDPNTVYLRDGDPYDFGYALLKTTDGGAQWTDLPLSVDWEQNALAIDPAMPSTLYAGTDRGVYQSIDGGATWSLAGMAATRVTLLAIDPGQSNVLYAAADASSASAGGLFKSTDSGATWSAINAGLEDLIGARARVTTLVLDPNQPGVLYIGTSGFGVFKSSDEGATWGVYNDGLGNLDVRTLTVPRGSAATVYAGTPGGVFKIAGE